MYKKMYGNDVNKPASIQLIVTTKSPSPFLISLIELIFDFLGIINLKNIESNRAKIPENMMFALAVKQQEAKLKILSEKRKFCKM